MRPSRLGAIPFDVPGVELGHHGRSARSRPSSRSTRCSRIRRWRSSGRIVNGADTDNSLYGQPEGAGLAAIAEGFRHLGLRDDHEINAAEWIVYDALYAYCQERVRRGKPGGASSTPEPIGRP